MSEKAQSAGSHAKFVPAYHYLTFALVMAVLISSMIQLFRGFSAASVIGLCLAVALLMTTLYSRIFALGVQDRVIRLEEHLRMERVLPDDLKARIGEITTDQLIGLRFASDAELGDLVRKVLDEGLRDRKAIKMAVKDWRADHQRI